jgi:hypothetical protein
MSHKPQHGKNNPPPKPKEHGTEKESTNRHVYIEPGAKIDFVQDLKDKYETAQGDSKTHSNKQLLWTKIAAGLLLLTAGFAGLQGILTREAITNNTTQFQIDQRPYVWDSNVTDPANVKIEAGQKMWINISLINFGKAPALRSKGVAKIFFGNNALQDADEWFAALGEKPLPDDPSDTGIVVPPGIPSGEITTKSAFGGGGYFTPMSDKVLTQEDVNYILHSNEAVAIVVHIQYFDAYNTRYWSNFCLSRFDTGTYPHCKRHNEMH